MPCGRGRRGSTTAVPPPDGQARGLQGAADRPRPCRSRQASVAGRQASADQPFQRCCGACNQSRKSACIGALSSCPAACSRRRCGTPSCAAATHRRVLPTPPAACRRRGRGRPGHRAWPVPPAAPARGSSSGRMRPAQHPEPGDDAFGARQPDARAEDPALAEAGDRRCAYGAMPWRCLQLGDELDQLQSAVLGFLGTICGPLDGERDPEPRVLPAPSSSAARAAAPPACRLRARAASAASLVSLPPTPCSSSSRRARRGGHRLPRAERQREVPPRQQGARRSCRAPRKALPHRAGRSRTNPSTARHRSCRRRPASRVRRHRWRRWRPATAGSAPRSDARARRAGRAAR